MSIKKTEQFLYFQNKARHYANISNAKPKVDDKLDKHYRHTIDQSSLDKNKKLEPYLKLHQKQLENKNLINRLTNITKSRRTQIEAQGNYSRFYAVERQFRKRNPYRDLTKRRIQIQNEEMSQRIDNTKAAVGSNSEWGASYKRQLSLRKHMSRYNQSQLSKGELLISTDRFVPEHYKDYLDKVQGQSQEIEGQTVRIVSKQKLIKFPQIGGRSFSLRQSQKSQKELDL